MSREKKMLSIATLFVIAGGALMLLNVYLGSFFIIVGLVMAFIVWRMKEPDGLGIQQKSYDKEDVAEREASFDIIWLSEKFFLRGSKIVLEATLKIHTYK